MILAFIWEEPNLKNMQIEWFEILYTGIFSAGIGYTLQIIAQHKANPAPAAIILSMESVFATIAGWILLNQILDAKNTWMPCNIFWSHYSTISTYNN